MGLSFWGWERDGRQAAIRAAADGVLPLRGQ
jgi:hypothetical protein